MITEEELAQLLGPLPGTEVPLVLFPVQLQTRFVTRDGAAQLLVRVYPDEVHVYSHEARLTGAEAQWGRAYWELIWSVPSNDEPALRAAWERLAERFGARRAAWVSRRMTPTNVGSRPAGRPAFPDPGPPRQDEHFVPAHARLLPDRWIVIGYRGDERVVLEAGQPIPRQLPVSLGSDDSPAPEVADDELPVDPGIHWMVDFVAAEEVGMGIRVALSDNVIQGGLDRLLVMGVRTASDPQADADELASVLDAHHYTRGLSFLAPGTPTNNTADASTDYSRRDPDPATSFRVEVRPPRLRAEADGALAARGFGVAMELFATIDGATLTEDRDARRLLTALWPATGGYYLGQLTGADPDSTVPFTQQDLDEARRFFIDFVRPQGPLPTLRVGRQPYGLLPVTSLDLMAGRTTEGPGPYLVNLRRMRHFLWRPALARVPRLFPGRQDDENLVEILRMQPTAVGYRTRLAFEREIFAPGEFLPDDLDPELREHRLQLAIRLAMMGISAQDWRMFDIIPAEVDRRLPDGAVKPEGAGPVAEYLTFLRTATVDDVLNERLPADRFPDGPPATLLYLLLRHAVLLAQTTTAYRILARRGVVPDAPYLEPALVGVRGGATPTPTLSLPRVLALDPALRDRLHTLRAADEPEADILDDLRASLEHLAGLPADRLVRHLNGCLDLFAYRLDAWITALATRQLREMRQRRPRGLVIGGFGWVEDLRPAPRNPVPTPPPGVAAPAFAATEPGGHLFAPSMSQAAAAAVLRSGFLAGTGEDGTHPFAIDLRSDRVRLAQWLLDGVREGQPLGALLGYRFERSLHERGLDRFIAGFRRVSVLGEVYDADDRVRRAEALPPGPARDAELRAARPALRRALDVVRQRYGSSASAPLAELERLAMARPADGLPLARRFQAGTTPFARVEAGLSAAERQQLTRELAALDAALDAVSDALTAESVYQAMRGNPARAAATVDAVAHGEIAPPELQVMQTPRTGTALTHRLVVLLPRPAQAPPPADARQARRAGEPALEPWLRHILGGLDQVRFSVEFRDGSGGAGGVLHTQDDVRLGLAGLSHMDIMYLTAGAQPGQPTDLDRLLEYELRRTAPPHVPESAQVVLVHKRRPDLPHQMLGLGEYLELLRPLRETILAARGVDGRDLAPAAARPESSVDVAELRGRADAATSALAQARDRLAAARETLAAAPDDIATGPLTQLLGTVRECLADLVFLGFSTAIPVSARGADSAVRSALLTQAVAVEQEASDRQARLAALVAGFDRTAASADEQSRHDQERLRTAYGTAFVVLPLVRAANGRELATALGASTDVQGGDPLQVHSWLFGTARVRPGASRLQAAIAYGGALGRPAAADLLVAQLPFRPGARWVAMPDPPPEGYPPGALSLVAHLPLRVQVDGACTGLLVDEWVEMVPSAEVTAGIAFHYEAPGARPPQSILLALAPTYLDRWNIDTLERTLLETLEQARLRALDPQVLAEDTILHRGLPALYFSLNTAGEALSTDFTVLGDAD
jgi:hypothetical protein